jgi:hypothetical protein
MFVKTAPVRNLGAKIVIIFDICHRNKRKFRKRWELPYEGWIKMVMKRRVVQWGYTKRACPPACP